MRNECCGWLFMHSCIYMYCVSHGNLENKQQSPAIEKARKKDERTLACKVFIAISTVKMNKHILNH